MSITAHSGRPGTGKSYNLARKGIKYLNAGFPVHSNFKLNWNGRIEKRTWYKKLWKRVLNKFGYDFEWKDLPASNLKYWNKLEDLYNIENGIILMDEMHVYMNARRWKDLPENMERKLAQHRKDGLHIEGTVQSVNRLDTIVRELIDYWYIYENNFFWFTRWEFNIDDDKQKKFPLSRRMILKRKKWYEAYDTLEKVEIKK